MTAPRPEQHIQRLAETFRGTWMPSHGIEPWLRRRLPRFTRMVQGDGWSWDDIGRAMTAAGIVYGTGKPWTGSLLARKAARVRAQLRTRLTQQATDAAARSIRLADQPMPPFVDVTQAAYHATPPANGPELGEPDEVYFAPVRFLDGSGPVPISPPTQPAPATAHVPQPIPAAKQDVEAVLRRFLGEAETTQTKD